MGGHIIRTIARVRCALLAIVAMFALSACMSIAGLMGMAPTTIQTAAQIDQLKLVADGASFAGSGKTITDHALSIATGYDCSVMSGLKGEALCASMCR
jgi:hypothetical protein